MTGSSDGDDADRAGAEAADWFARMRGPDAASWADGLAAWRASDAENDAAYDRLLRRWDQSAFLTNAALGRGRDLSRAAIWSRRPVLRGAIAASILLVAGLGALMVNRVLMVPATGASADYASLDGRVRAVTLADGSRITLDAGSRITVVEAQDGRRVTLRGGRARFENDQGLAHRFVVTAAGGSIIGDRGQFDVSLDGGTVKVIAWRGRVAVSGVGAPMARLAAGQLISFDPSGQAAGPVQADPGELGWTRGMLSFDRVRLAEAVEAINRYRHRRIQLGAPAIGDLRITGAFSAADPEGFARAVADMFHLSLGSTPDGAILLAPEKKT